jgi:hypothetical protein
MRHSAPINPTAATFHFDTPYTLMLCGSSRSMIGGSNLSSRRVKIDIDRATTNVDLCLMSPGRRAAGEILAQNHITEKDKMQPIYPTACKAECGRSTSRPAHGPAAPGPACLFSIGGERMATVLSSRGPGRRMQAGCGAQPRSGPGRYSRIPVTSSPSCRSAQPHDRQEEPLAGRCSTSRRCRLSCGGRL